MAEEYEVVELEYSEEDILYYLVDENDNEVGFVIDENGFEVECYYEGYNEDDYELVDEPVDTTPKAAEPYIPEKAEDHGYLHKIAAIAGHEGGKARAKAETTLDSVRGKAVTEAGKAKAAATEQASKAKAAADDAGVDISREGVKQTTADLNAIAKEGAETAKELKEAYDDIMENFDFLIPKKIRRRLP